MDSVPRLMAKSLVYIDSLGSSNIFMLLNSIVTVNVNVIIFHVVCLGDYPYESKKLQRQFVAARVLKCHKMFVLFFFLWIQTNKFCVWVCTCLCFVKKLQIKLKQRLFRGKKAIKKVKECYTKLCSSCNFVYACVCVLVYHQPASLSGVMRHVTWVSIHGTHVTLDSGQRRAISFT